jgi:transcriptional regulator with XRE-family HTH domain
MKEGWGQRIAAARAEINMTIPEASEKSGVSLKAINAIETEKTAYFSLYDLNRYRKIIGISLNYIWGTSK